MSDVVIRVENLTKEYRLGVINHGTLHQDLQSWWARVRGKEDPNSLISASKHLTLNNSPFTDSDNPHMLALDDVSFDVKQGEILGIIGRNGAGKSTLLKILSRVTAPTRGSVKIKGRVASLLEVGTGFHPELTGRENIYLNGAILGMTKWEIIKKFDEIVTFAEIEQFIDTPVKRYSSGMYVRLAFAVAAHLDPDILIIDEVLAVGDASFQKKCLGKIGDIAKGRRTVLFVSHNMTAVRNICNRVVWLDSGKVKYMSETDNVIEKYLRQSFQTSSQESIESLIKSLPPDPLFRLKRINILQKGRPCDAPLNGESIDIEIYYQVLKKTTGLRVYFDVCDEDRNILIRSFQDEHADFMSSVDPGHYKSVATIPANLLAPRTYDIVFYAASVSCDERSCLPKGIVIPISVQSSNKINRAYISYVVKSKLQPHIFWETKSMN